MRYITSPRSLTHFARLPPMIPKRHFRQAPPASNAWNLWKTFLQSIVFWGVFLLLLPLALLAVEHALGLTPFRFRGQCLVAVLLFFAASALNITTAVTMVVRGQGTPLPTDGPRQLVITGPYRWVRNPMAIAGLAQGLAVGLGLGSWLMPLAVVAGGLLWNYLVRPVEEQHLAELYGNDYRAYQSQVDCWLPRFPASP